MIMCALKKRLKHNFIFYQYFLSNEILIIYPKNQASIISLKIYFLTKVIIFISTLFIA